VPLSAILKIDPFEFRWIRLSYPFVIGVAFILWLVFQIKNRRGPLPPEGSGDDDKL